MHGAFPEVGLVALDASLLRGGSGEGEGKSQDRVLSNVLAPTPVLPSPLNE